MAARVNSRFIIIMLATVSVAAGAVGGLWYWQKRGDAERLVNQGDELFARGEYRQATEHFGRAIRRQPGNIEWVRKFESAVVAQRPETSDGARDLYGQWLMALRLAAEYRASDPDAQLRLIEELHDSARLAGRFAGEAGQRGLWREVENAAENMLSRVPESEPRRAYGLLYRGMATLQQRRTLTEEDIRRAEQDIVDFIEAMPNHDRGWAALAQGQMVLEELARIGGDPRRLAERRQRLAQVMRDAHAAVPTGAEVGIAYASYLLRPNLHPAGAPAPTEEEIEAAVNSAVAAVSRLSDAGDRSAPWLILGAAEVALERGGPAALPVATRLIENHLARDEQALAHRLTLANLLARGQDFAQAQALAEQILQAGTVGVSFVAQMQSAIQTAAAGLLAEIEYRRWTRAPDDEEHIGAMRAAVTRLDRFVTDPENDPRMVRAAGKLALMESRFPDAAAKFEKLIREGYGDAEILLASAYVLQRIGELGLAHDRVTAAAEGRGGAAPSALRLKAELEIALGRLDEAEESVRHYLQVIPSGDSGAAETGSRLLRTIAARRQGVVHDADDPVASALHRAQAAMSDEAGTGTGEGAENARAILIAALDAHPEDVRLLATLASLAMNAGDTESAGVYIDRALAIAPEHPALRQLAAVVRSGDPLDAAVEFFGEIEDEVERNAAVLRGVSSIRAQELARAEAAARRTAQGEAGEEQRLAALARAERAQAIIAEAGKRLREIAPDHAVLIEHEFNDAIAARDWALAGQIVQRARRHNSDRMNGLFYEGRLELERHPPRPENAVRAFQAATEHRPFSNTAWRGLAVAYQRVGNFREAVRAFEQAHAINPNEPQTIRGYLGLLLQIGDHTRAVRVARDAARVMPGNLEMREIWLVLEAEHGNLGAALDRRNDIYQSSPGDRTNAMQLARLLAQAQPRFDLLRDDRGEPRYTERQWNQLRVSDQRRILEGQRETWTADAERIVNELLARDAARAGAGQGALPDLELVALRAALIRERGDASGGEKVLRDHIALVEATDEQTAVSRAMLALANFQVDAGRPNDAVATMRQAQRVQDPVRRGADLALADFLFVRGQFEQARALYEEVQKTAPSRAIRLRIIECAINMRQFDQAETLIASPAVGPAADPQTGSLPAPATGDMEHGTDFMVEMLRALIARGRADDLLMRGRTADAEIQAERFRTALSAAQRLNPASPAPHILNAQALIAEFRRTRQRDLIDKALTALDRAEAGRAGDVQTAMARVEVHRAAGNTRAAIAELNRILERTPAQGQARRLLVQLHIDGGNVAAAIETIEAAIEHQPTVAAWHEMLGNVLANPEAGRRGGRAAAAAAFGRAYELSKSPAILSRIVSALIAPGIGAPNEKPDFAAAVQVLQNQRDVMEREPALEAVFAHVLIGAGRESEGRQRLARSYKRFRDQIKEGERQPSDIASWHQAASTAMESMSSAEIESMIREQGEGYPDRFDLLWLARREAGRGSQHLPAALDFLNRALNAHDADAGFRTGVLFEMSNFQIAMEEFSAAAEILTEVVAAAPNNWVAQNNLAFVKADRLGRAQAALPHALRAVELQPNEPSVLDTVGWVYFKLGDHTRAEEFLQRSLTVNETARTQVHMAEVLIATRRFDAALTRLRRAAELNPDPQTQADIDRLTDDIRTKRASA